jgi:pimeloyl-ACP methyl ester carboxylesterase
MTSVDVGGLQIAYRRAGEGPALVLLHGAAADSRVWRPQLEGLADRFTVVAWDEPGAGRSTDPGGEFALADYADSLAEFIDALGLGPAHVAGLSWGGVLALELYRRHATSVASLILADTYAGWRGSLPAAECDRRLAAVVEQTSMPAERFVATLPGLFGGAPPAAVVEELDSIMADVRPASMRRVTVAIANCDQRDLLGRIDVPTLLIWGKSDVRSPLHVAEQLRDGIPGARLVVIPGAGHVSNMERPAEFNRAIRTFAVGPEAGGSARSAAP